MLVYGVPRPERLPSILTDQTLTVLPPVTTLKKIAGSSQLVSGTIVSFSGSLTNYFLMRGDPSKSALYICFSNKV